MSRKSKIKKLLNRYTGDIVYCEDMETVRESDGIEFIQVYNSENPSRKFLVNKEAFQIVKDK